MYSFPRHEPSILTRLLCMCALQEGKRRCSRPRVLASMLNLVQELHALGAQSHQKGAQLGRSP